MALVILDRREVQPLIIKNSEAAVDCVFPSLIGRRGRFQPVHLQPSDPSATLQE